MALLRDHSGPDDQLTHHVEPNNHTELRSDSDAVDVVAVVESECRSHDLESNFKPAQCVAVITAHNCSFRSAFGRAHFIALGTTHKSAIEPAQCFANRAAYKFSFEPA